MYISNNSSFYRLANRQTPRFSGPNGLTPAQIAAIRAQNQNQSTRPPTSNDIASDSLSQPRKRIEERKRDLEERKRIEEMEAFNQYLEASQKACKEGNAEEKQILLPEWAEKEHIRLGLLKAADSKNYQKQRAAVKGGLRKNLKGEDFFEALEAYGFSKKVIKREKQKLAQEALNPQQTAPAEGKGKQTEAQVSASGDTPVKENGKQTEKQLPTPAIAPVAEQAKQTKALVPTPSIASIEKHQQAESPVPTLVTSSVEEKDKLEKGKQIEQPIPASAPATAEEKSTSEKEKQVGSLVPPPAIATAEEKAKSENGEQVEKPVPVSATTPTVGKDQPQGSSYAAMASSGAKRNADLLAQPHEPRKPKGDTKPQHCSWSTAGDAAKEGSSSKPPLKRPSNASASQAHHKANNPFSSPVQARPTRTREFKGMLYEIPDGYGRGNSHPNAPEAGMHEYFHLRDRETGKLRQYMAVGQAAKDARDAMAHRETHPEAFMAKLGDLVNAAKESDHIKPIEEFSPPTFKLSDRTRSFGGIVYYFPNNFTSKDEETQAEMLYDRVSSFRQAGINTNDFRRKTQAGKPIHYVIADLNPPFSTAQTEASTRVRHIFDDSKNPYTGRFDSKRLGGNLKEFIFAAEEAGCLLPISEASKHLELLEQGASSNTAMPQPRKLPDTAKELPSPAPDEPRPQAELPVIVQEGSEWPTPSGLPLKDPGIEPGWNIVSNAPQEEVSTPKSKMAILKLRETSKESSSNLPSKVSDRISPAVEPTISKAEPVLSPSKTGTELNPKKAQRQDPEKRKQPNKSQNKAQSSTSTGTTATSSTNPFKTSHEASKGPKPVDGKDATWDVKPKAPQKETPKPERAVFRKPKSAATSKPAEPEHDHASSTQPRAQSEQPDPKPAAPEHDQVSLSQPKAQSEQSDPKPAEPEHSQASSSQPKAQNEQPAPKSAEPEHDQASSSQPKAQSEQPAPKSATPEHGHVSSSQPKARNEQPVLPYVPKAWDDSDSDAEDDSWREALMKKFNQR
jgi:hypothetical protein